MALCAIKDVKILKNNQLWSEDLVFDITLEVAVPLQEDLLNRARYTKDQFMCTAILAGRRRLQVLALDKHKEKVVVIDVGEPGLQLGGFGGYLHDQNYTQIPIGPPKGIEVRDFVLKFDFS